MASRPGTRPGASCAQLTRKHTLPHGSREVCKDKRSMGTAQLSSPASHLGAGQRSWLVCLQPRLHALQRVSVLDTVLPPGSTLRVQALKCPKGHQASHVYQGHRQNEWLFIVSSSLKLCDVPRETNENSFFLTQTDNAATSVENRARCGYTPVLHCFTVWAFGGVVPTTKLPSKTHTEAYS